MQVDALVQRRKEGGAAAHDDRMEEEPVLVDQAQLHERGGQVGPAFGGYPFTFYAEGGPFPPTTVKNQGECKAALKFFHSQFPG